MPERLANFVSARGVGKATKTDQNVVTMATHGHVAGHRPPGGQGPGGMPGAGRRGRGYVGGGACAFMGTLFVFNGENGDKTMLIEGT